MERYELVEGSSSKFWQWKVEGSELIVEYGRIGTSGQSSTKSFDSAASANAASAKLVREKTGKGYVLVGGASAKAPPAAKAAKPAAVKPAKAAKPAKSAELPADMAALAIKLGKKMSSIKNAFQWLIDEVGFRRATTSLWPMAASGALTPKAQLALMHALALHADLATPEQLPAVLARLPKNFAEGTPCRFDGYPVTVDAILTHAASRATEALAAVEGSLPAALQRALPFVRAHLGQKAVAPAPELMAEFVQHHLNGDPSATFVWMPTDGKLVLSFYEHRFEVAATLASVLGPREAFEAAIKAAAFEGAERKHRASWRAEPYYLACKDLSQLLSQTWSDGDFQWKALMARKDPPEALLAALKKLESDTVEVVGDRVAAIIGLRLGKDVPKQLDAMLDFEHGPDAGKPGYSDYLAGLRAFGKERIWARVDAIVKKSDDPLDAFVGLAAFWDEKRFSAVVKKDPDIVRHSGKRLGKAGPEAIPTLVAMLAALPADDDAVRKREELRGAVSIAARSADDLDPTWDPFLGDCYDWAPVLSRLPGVRRDAVLLAEQERDVTNLANFVLGSDAALDQAIGRLAARRKSVDKNDFALKHAFEKLGARATAPLLKHFAGKTDAAARNVLDVTMLDDDAYARLTGGATALPIVSGDVKKGAKYLDLVAAHLMAAAPVGKLSTGGKIAFAEEGMLDQAKVLDRAVPAGAHAVTAYYSDADLDALPTAGLEALMVRFVDGAVASWEETLSGKKAVMGKDDLVAFALADAARAKSAGDKLATAFQKHIHDHVASGEAVGLMDEDRVILAYVGEVAILHKLHWGLAADGTPVCLVAAFVLPRGGDDD